MRILAIGAHPDDIELGCGGALIKAARSGHQVFMYTLTNGSAGGNPEERTKELMSSAKYIGADALWVDNFEDTRLSVNSTLINHIEYFVHASAPDIIFTHSLGDYHHDHRAIAESTIEAARFSQNILAYEIPVTKNFNPQIFYDISDVVEDKVELIKMFWSQKNKLFTRASSIKGLAEYRAFQSRLNTSINAVESFEVLKLCLAKDFSLLTMPQQPLPEAVINGIDLRNIIQYRPKLVLNQQQQQQHLESNTNSEQLNSNGILTFDKKNDDLTPSVIHEG